MMVLSSLRARWTSLIGAFLAVAIGVALVAGMGLGLAAAADAPGRAPERFTSSPVIVMGHDTLRVGDDRQRLTHPHPVDIELLRDLRALGPVERDDRGGRGGRDDRGERGGQGEQGGRPDAVGVTAPAAQVRAVVGDRAQVLTGADRARANPDPDRDERALVAVNSFLGTAGGVAAFVSVFVTAATFAFVVALRRRELGLLRMAGATPGQVRRLLLAEAVTVGGVAAVAGCAAGAWAAPLLGDALVEAGIAPSWFSVPALTWTAWPYQMAFWTGLLVAFSGAWTAARRAGRTGPVEALREASVDTGVMPAGRRLVGAALLATGIGLLAWTLWTDPSDLLKRKTYTTQPMILITAVAALAPLLVRPLVRAVRLPGAIGLLVRENAATSVRRTAAVAAPVLVTVALAGSLLGSATSVGEAKAAEARERTRAELVVTGGDLDTNSSTGSGTDGSGTGGSGTGLKVPPRPVQGVRVLSPSVSTPVHVREEGTALIRSEARAVSDPAALARTARLPVVAGDVRDLDDQSIVVNEEWAHHRVGERVRVWLGDGRPVTLRIAAVLAQGTGDNGAYVTSANSGAGGGGSGAAVDRIDVRLDAGADRAAVARALRAATGGEVRTADAWLAATHPRTKEQTRLGLLMLLGISLLYTAISLASTLLMASSVRGPELRSLRLAGATRAQIRLVAAGEATVAVAVGALLGLAVTLVNLGGLNTALTRLSAPVAGLAGVPWGTVGACAAVCWVVALVAGVATAARGL
ncbi:FtsX-like permease family protein [Streptomyces sp. NPDC059009]|uniref:FtsX-like permease family protein n=1 Tax=Streptomyces sp. NPDC059009 TaxID=3346694 RepID=UPI0036C3B68F